ncbi:unnamed protein product [Lactuca virosa]|uniref:Uncharacterized protein n=1 Tax=Lactuca virosa TaxID=75947 RepID=A0AAU9NZA5_9ASTR|nr:unnamed protein product [Lactuca virosa]
MVVSLGLGKSIRKERKSLSHDLLGEDGVFGLSHSYGGTLATSSFVASSIDSQTLLIPRGTATEQYHHSNLNCSDHRRSHSQSNQSLNSYPISAFTFCHGEMNSGCTASACN